MLAKLGVLLDRTIGRFIPDPFILALGLTVLTAVAALLCGFGDEPRGEAANSLLKAWWGSDGIWKFLAFSMKMALILVTGFALAESKPVQAFISFLAGFPRSTPTAAALIGFIAAAAGLINWGLGLIVGAMLALQVARRLESRSIRAHYPLLCAAGYVGLLVWHGGLSGTAPIMMTKADEVASLLPAETVASLNQGTIPLQETIFSSLNLFVSLGLLAIIPATLFFLAPRRDDQIETASDLAIDITSVPNTDSTPRSGPIACALNITVGIALLLGMGFYLASDSGGIGRLGPNEINATMLGLGMLLHVSPTSYVRAVERAARGCAGIILQFPLYAGIMVMMSVSGLMAMLAQAASDVSTPDTLGLLTFISAGVVNFLVPSGGGQWGIQGPVALQSAVKAGVSPQTIVMSVAYGDQLTNMLQPFWALPLLAITGIKARKIVPLTAIVMVVAGAWMALGLLLF